MSERDSKNYLQGHNWTSSSRPPQTSTQLPYSMTDCQADCRAHHRDETSILVCPSSADHLAISRLLMP